MQKYLGVFVIGGMVGFGCATTFGAKVVASQNTLQAAPAMTVTVDEVDEHVRHMRMHKKTEEMKESPKGNPASDTAEQAKITVDQTPTGSLKPVKPRKARLLAHKKRKIADEQEVVAEQASPAETESPAAPGFFDTLFHGN